MHTCTSISAVRYTVLWIKSPLDSMLTERRATYLKLFPLPVVYDWTIFLLGSGGICCRLKSSSQKQKYTLHLTSFSETRAQDATRQNEFFLHEKGLIINLHIHVTVTVIVVHILFTDPAHLVILYHWSYINDYIYGKTSIFNVVHFQIHIVYVYWFCVHFEWVLLLCMTTFQNSLEMHMSLLVEEWIAVLHSENTRF